MRFDSTNFTSARDRVRLLLWASQNELNPKRGEIKVFKAVALTDAVPLSTYDQGSYGSKTGTSSKAVIGRYVMRVRIKDDLYTTNPHQYLPNPCKLSSATNIAQAIKLIKMHTLCLTAEDYQHGTQDSIRKDDIVEITLNMNRETNTLNTNHGLITKLIERKNERTDTSAFCPDLKGAFNIRTIALLSSFARVPDSAPAGDNTTLTGNEQTDEEDTLPLPDQIKDNADANGIALTTGHTRTGPAVFTEYTGMTEEQIIAALVAEHIAWWDARPDAGEMVEIRREARLYYTGANP